MTVKQVIGELKRMNLEKSLEKLIDVGAPQILLEKATKNIEDAKTVNFKVSGLSRKFPVADVQVTELYQADVTGLSYNGGKYSTVVLKMMTDSGIFYYNLVKNKISDTMCGMEVTNLNPNFLQVDMDNICK